jgi:arsenate reductase
MKFVFHVIKFFSVVKVFDFRQNPCGSTKMIFLCKAKVISMRLFYYLSSCDTCKRILNELKLKDTITQIDIKKNPLTTAQVEDLHKRVGRYEDLINKRAQLYKQRNLKEKSLSEQDYKTLLLEHYTFLKRPVLVYEEHIFVGNAAKTVAEAKAFLDEQ